jgi:NitT/TauT family transport system ATP-binding protein
MSYPPTSITGAVAVTLREVTHRYPGDRQAVPALWGITLDIPAGGVTCFVGPSGCGKSTLCRMIAGLERPSEGRIAIDNSPVDGPGAARVLMFQDAGLFPWLTVLDNVCFGVRLQGGSGADSRAQALNCLRLVQLSRFARSYPHELSGGMRQRVALARALAVRPRVLLMDEPFGALDAQTRDILLDELQRIWQATDTTLIYVTHNVQEAVLLGSQVALFTARPGRLKRVMTLAHLPRPRYAGDRAVQQVVDDIHDELRQEIEQVERETFDLDWHLEHGPRAGRAFELGDGI